MRTNIEIDDKLIQAAFRFTSVTTKRELIDLALKEFIENHRRLDVRELRGKVKLREDYDHKALRSDYGDEE